MGYTLTKAEQETTVRWDADERKATIFSADPVSIRKLDRLCEQHPDVYRKTWTDGIGARYECAARFIRFGKPPTEARIAAARRNTRGFAAKPTNTSIPASSTDADEQQEG